MVPCVLNTTKLDQHVQLWMWEVGAWDTKAERDQTGRQLEALTKLNGEVLEEAAAAMRKLPLLEEALVIAPMVLNAVRVSGVAPMIAQWRRKRTRFDF